MCEGAYLVDTDLQDMETTNISPRSGTFVYKSRRVAVKIVDDRGIESLKIVEVE